LTKRNDSSGYAALDILKVQECGRNQDKSSVIAVLLYVFVFVRSGAIMGAISVFVRRAAVAAVSVLISGVPVSAQAGDLIDAILSVFGAPVCTGTWIATRG
jgi:hypothetical protein